MTTKPRARSFKNVFINSALLYILIFFSSFLNAAPSYSCPGETLSTLDGATGDATQSYSNNIVQNNITQYTKFTTSVDGVLTFTMDRHSLQQRVKLSDDHCNGNSVYNTKASSNINETINITAGVTYYIKIKEKNGANRLRFDTLLTFTAAKNADLELTENTDPSPVSGKINDDITFTTHFENKGPSTAKKNIIVKFTYSMDVIVGSVPGGLSCTKSSGLLTAGTVNTCTYASDVPNGTTYDLVTTVKPQQNGSLTQTTNVSSATTDPSPGNNGVDSKVVPIVSNIKAVNDAYSTDTGITISVSATNGLLANDLPDGNVAVTSNTNPSNGSVTIDYATGAFTYTPNAGYQGVDTFTYTITSTTGETDSATVSISVNITNFPAAMGFNQINPQSTQNIIGDYEIMGNTALCITSATTGYRTQASCSDSTANVGNGVRTSNNYVAAFIDIDTDPNTWNSSSSNLNLPAVYDRQGGKGILWAGMVWQGRFVGSGARQRLHYHNELSGGGFSTTETGNNVAASTVTLAQADARYIRLGIDGGAYSRVTADTVYSLSSSGGTTYSAIADVTQLVQSANLASGPHTFTVANLPTSEGRENTPGVYGGWTMVVIYAEKALGGKPRNISIYGGMDILRSATSAANVPILISGFKLPSSGNTVAAKLSIFAGEGELPYRPDGVQIGLTATGPWQNMPTSSSQTNIFDAIMNDISRDNVPAVNNLQNNNVGIDVDNFVLDTIISNYPRTTTQFFLKWYSDGDYIIPGLIAFSTELYQPEICYDYTLDIGGHILPSVNNEVNTSYHHYNPRLTTHVAVRSLEKGDFLMENFSFTARTDTKYLSYIDGTAAVSPDLIYGYEKRPIHSKDDPKASSFTLNIGENPGIGKGNGGTIASGETTFLRFDHNMSLSESFLESNITMQVNYTVDYGSGPVPIAQILDSSSLCKGGAGAYDPTYGMFNVVGAGAGPTTYGMKTQVAGLPYGVRAYGYKADNVTPEVFDTAIEMEIFNANFFVNETILSCNNPDSNVTHPKFIKFNNVKYVDIPSEQYNVAKRNAGYRVWYLKDMTGGLVEHSCVDRTDETCFQAVYTNKYSGDGNCTAQCSAGGTECYKCLRRFYGKPVCSRDNFAIRPETYLMTLNDTNATSGATKGVGDNTVQTRRRVAGGYNYNMNVAALAYGTVLPVSGYVRGFNSRAPYTGSLSSEGATMINDFNNTASCNNLNHEDLQMSFWEGNGNGQLIARDVGNYHFRLLDTTWTLVDQNASNLGCILGSASTIPSTNAATLGLIGCNVNSSYTSPAAIGGATYYDYNLTVLPFKFDMKTVIGQVPSGNGFMYSNTLGVNTPPAGTLPFDNNMSLDFTGTIDAVGADNSAMKNFVMGCFAKDLNVTVNAVTNPAVPTDINGNALQMRWLEETASDVNGADTLKGTSGAFGVSNAVALGRNIARNDQGKNKIDYRVNFDRSTNVPHNPFSYRAVDMTVECDVNANCNVNAKQQASYVPKGKEIFVNTRTAVLYGRVNAPRVRTMCSGTGNCNANVTFFYEFYSDKNDNNRSVLNSVVGNTPQRSLNSANWYQNGAHRTATDGNVSFVNYDMPLGTKPVFVQNISTTSTTFNYTGTRGYPYKSTILIPRNTTKGTQSWLVYDKYNANATSVRGEVEFYGPGEWSSTTGAETSVQGKSGKRNKNTNRRIRW